MNGMIDALNPIAKPKEDLSTASKFQNGAKAAYWSYKAFQALAVCSGDMTALAEMGAECVAEGLCESAVAEPGMMLEAADAVMGAQAGVKAFRKDVKHFSQFSAALSNQLNAGGNPQIDGRTMESAGDLYNKLVARDRDGSGGASLKEYVDFSAREGVPRSVAESMFFRADVHGRGKISFGEWKAMMVGRAGRDKGTFNCGGHHGLTQYVAGCNGMACDFCGTHQIRAGELAKGCRLCDCDACASCSERYSARPLPPPPPLPPRPGVRVAPTPPPAFPQAYPEVRASGERPRAFDCRRRHGLAPFTVGVGRSVYCSWCGSFVPPGQQSFGCRACEMNGCADCAAASLGAPDGSASALTCPGRHGLVVAQQAGVGCLCDFCRLRVAAGAKVFSCRACGVHACVACVWKDHRRALSTGGEFTCEHFTTHAARPVDITTPQQQLRRRCSWCLGAPILGHTMMRCDPCDCDVCALCVATAPAQEAKVQRVREAAHTVQQPAGTKVGTQPPERLLHTLSTGEITGPLTFVPPPTAPVLPSSKPPLSPPPGYSPGRPLSPPPCYSPQAPLSPPPRYGDEATPARSGRAGAEETTALQPLSYHATTAETPPGTFLGEHAAYAGAKPRAADATVTRAPAVPPCQDTGAISSFPGGPQGPPSYFTFAKAGEAGAGNGSGSNPPPFAPCSPEREVLAPTASAADGGESPFEFDSVVRVLGVEDPEVNGKLLTVIGFKVDGGRGTVVLSRRGRVFLVPASKVHEVVD